MPQRPPRPQTLSLLPALAVALMFFMYKYT